MDDLQQIILQTWARLAPRLQREPFELQRRLARGRASLRNPPRSWCLAIRASDTRLASVARVRGLPREPLEPHREQVTLDRGAIRRLCAPVTLDPPGMTLEELAARLGITRTGLLRGRVDGVFQTHHVRGLGGHWGKPRPLLYTARPLDPASRGFLGPDPLWPAVAHLLIERLPRDLPRTITFTRIAKFQVFGPHCRDPRGLHPEHPAPDPPPPSHTRRRSLTLPPPAPDYVWYKWDGDDYLGYDRHNSLARANHERHQHDLQMVRAAKKCRRRAKEPGLSPSKGSLKFRGWQWLCPRCARPVNVLFLPLPPLLNDEVRTMNDERKARRNTSSFIVPTSSFACEKCLRLRRYTACDPNAWNELVRYLSSGLLYGREVPRPKCLPSVASSHRRSVAVPGRKLPYKPRPNREPSRRRPQIERLLLAGLSFQQIAIQFRLAKGTVLWYARQVYKHHGVRTLPELLTKHGQTPKPTKREDVRRRIEAGQTVPQIASEMGISRMCVYNLVYVLKKTGLVERKRVGMYNRTERHESPVRGTSPR